MPSILSDEDKETVKRQVPKASNKIQAVAVARLYVAYPNRSRWTYTGLQGAAVLANDLVGNTYWLKMVDISPSGRGVIWDQEIYDTWSYNQDRTFFHTFETEDCLAGLSFVDEKEAKTFLKKMNDREKNASKQTKATKFGGSAQPSGGGKHSILGGIFGGHKHSSAPVAQSPAELPSYVLPPVQSQKQVLPAANGGRSEFAALDALDANWRITWGEDLKQMGITDDLIRDNQDFIADYIREQQATQASRVSTNGSDTQRNRAPPPPPPVAPPSRARSESPVPAPKGRGAPPAVPPARRTAPAPKPEPVARHPTPPREPSPPRGPPPPRFAAPPPFEGAGKFAHTNDKPVSRPHASSISNQGPPPPPRPLKTPSQDYEPGESGSRYGVPPPFTGVRNTAPPTPQRAQVPPPPPARDAQPPQPPRPHAVPPAPAFSAPPLPPKIPSAPSTAAPPLPPSSARPVPPPPARDSAPPPPPRESAPHPPPLPQSSAPAIPTFSGGPPPPPPPPGGLDGHPAPPPRVPPASSFNGPPAPPPPPPPPASSTHGPPAPPPPPPPPTNMAGPPAPPPPPPPPGAAPGGPPAPPPPPPNRDSGYASGVPSLPQPSGDRAGLLAGIQKAGGIGSLKKVDPSQVRDRSAAFVPGSADTSSPGPASPPIGGPAGGGSVMDSLAAALAQRKQKVSASDDEADDDDEW